MIHSLLPLLALLILFVGVPAHGGEVLWVDLGGKGQDTQLHIDQGWPLIHFTRNMPYWHPVQMEKVELPDGRVGWRRAGASPTNTLFWTPLDESPRIRRLGAVGGIKTYEVEYSRLYHVIVWDRGGWSFTPAVIVDADESIVVGIHPGRVFHSESTDLLHVRIQFQGTGHFQRSLFFTAVEGTLVQLSYDDSVTPRIEDYDAKHKIRPFHRGLGFCEDSLVEMRLVESDPSSNPDTYYRGAWLEVRYRVDGVRLFLDHIGFAEERDECVIFPEWR